MSLAGESRLWAGIGSGLGSVGSSAGDIEINATGTINLTNSSLISNAVLPDAVGNGGDINITTGSLAVNDNAKLIHSTYGQGNAGAVQINASDTVSFDGASSNEDNTAAFSNDPVSLDGVTSLENNKAGAFSNVQFGDEEQRAIWRQLGAVGNGGDINITTGSLFVRNGSELSARTWGQGDAGSVNINALDTVFFDWENSNEVSSAAFSAVEEGATGNGGDINITTGSLFLRNGSALSARNEGQGDAGNITIKANTLEASNGGQVITSSLSSGKAGNITLNVTDSVTLTGSDPTYNARDTDFFAEVSVGPASGLFANTSENSTGQGGSLRLTTEQLSVRDGAEVTVSSEKSGSAGDLAVSADSIRLDTRSNIRATTAGGNQGSISLRSQDLVLRGGSNIRTDATGTATGGNITIDTGVLAALENSDISANSANSFGGRVIIDAQGIFGTEYREDETSQSDITASSSLGREFSGTVDINNPDVDPSQGLVELPAEVVDVSNSIAQGCSAGVRRGETKFVITGRGGLPPNPKDPLTGDNVLTEWNTLDSDAENRSSATPATNTTLESANTTIVEANGWMTNDKGEVILIATAPTATLNIPWLPKSDCNAPEHKT